MKPQDYFVRHECGSDRIALETALAASRLPFYGILDRVRSAHNVGSIFRTADGANAAGLFLCGYTPTPPHRHLAKTALGAVDVVPWQYCATVEEAIVRVRSEGAQILAVERTDGSLPLFGFGIKFPVALVMGNEVGGLSEETLSYCDATVHLPMHGLKNSLNVSVAFGIALYEILRRYESERII
ncbi:MAG TPA: RNA methyltransferase [Abditibacteriaceae bacterium]|nr:RNA methyltransferase [Abditibacteriaceae bacterium]